MRLVSAIFYAVLLAVGGVGAAESPFTAPGWAIEARFPAAPTKDEVRTPSEQGDVLAVRYFVELSGERYMLVRFTYPVAMLPGEEAGVYDRSMSDMMKSRPGEVQKRQPYLLGDYSGERLVINQRREKTTREVRLIVVGSSLYVLSAEWPVAGKGAATATAFFDSIRLLPDYQNARVVEEKERWREIGSGNVKLRYDAARWFRDPADQEPGIYNLLRVDQKAEAQFIVEDHPIEGGDIEAAVLKTANEGAESVIVKKRGKKFRGNAQMIELVFNARVEGEVYINHGYFYSGPIGAVQLRGWATDKTYGEMDADITELLDGLSVGAR